MKRSHTQEVERIVYLWLGFVDKNEKHESIGRSGPSMMGKFCDFKGQLPGSSGMKPETLGKKADMQMSIEIFAEEFRARDALMSLPIDLRCCVAIWPQLRKKINERTKKLFTETDVIFELKTLGLEMSYDDYLIKKDIGGSVLLTLWLKLPSNSHESALRSVDGY